MRQSSSGPSSSSTQNISSHADRSPLSTTASFVARDSFLLPVKRRRESQPGPSTPSAKQYRLYDDELPTPPSTPLLSLPHTPLRKAKVEDDVLELTGSEDDYVAMELINPMCKSVSPKKRVKYSICDEVIEISD